MASFGNLGMSASSKVSALRSSANSGARLAYGPQLPGTGFEFRPPLTISTELFHFLKCLGLNSVGLSLVCVPFRGGWELVEWKPSMTVAEQIKMEFDLLCAEIENEEGVELGYLEILEIVDETNLEVCEVFVGPQIELDLGEGNSIHDVEPVIEVPGVVPTVVVEEEDSSVELISVKETISDQAEGTGGVPVPNDVQMVEAAEAIGTGVPVPSSSDRSGAVPDPMKIVDHVRTGEVPVLEEAVEGIGSEPVPEVGVDRTGVAPVHEVLETGTSPEPVPEEFEQYPGGVPEVGSG